MSLCVKDSTVAGLLIFRELQLCRLEELKSAFPAGAPSGLRERVSAPAFPASIRAAFERRVLDAGLSTDQAASILYRTELQERWLERALNAV